MKVNCKSCEKEFNKLPSEINKTKNNFCSRSCAAHFNNFGRQRNKPVDRVCSMCIRAFTMNANHRSKKHCPDCVIAYKDEKSNHLN